MNNYEKSVKLSLIEKVLSEARANMEMDMLLQELHTEDSAENPTTFDDESNEAEIMFSLIEYIIHLDLSNEELLTISPSTSLCAKVSPAYKVIEVTFINDSINNDAPAITLEFLESNT